MKLGYLLHLVGTASLGVGKCAINVDQKPEWVGIPFPDGFLSYSIEFSSFPDFAGNKTSPNKFSETLLMNIGNVLGTKPYIRVGGNTQDYALYNASLSASLNGTYDVSRSPDYPTTIHIGPSYFESYSTWPGVKFSHGFNLGLGGNRSEGWQTLLDTAPLVCKTLGLEKLYAWQYGNEPDLYSTSSQGPVRPPSWNETTYVEQWLNGTRKIKELLQTHCPEVASSNRYEYIAPAFAGVNNHLKAPIAWKDGLDEDGNIGLFSSHNYISGATSPGVTLQGTLMNHSRTMQSVNAHVDEFKKIFPSGDLNTASPRLILGETNSLYNQGKPGLSNTFGAALWGVDFALYCASVGIGRVHYHMGTNYRYASWQPVDTDKAVKGTKAPYYGNMAVAAMIGNATDQPVSIAHVPIAGGDEREAVYAAYVGDSLSRIMVINFVGYNTTANGTGLGLAGNPDAKRESRMYTFEIGPSVREVSVQRLMANGSDAITGVTWDGYSFNYELEQGDPVLLTNVTRGEVLQTTAGRVTIDVLDSSAAMLSMSGGDS